MSNDLEFPKPIRAPNGRLYWIRSELETYKRKLIHQATGATGEAEPVHIDVESFVPPAQVSEELGFGRRTLGRRIAATPKIVEAV